MKRTILFSIVIILISACQREVPKEMTPEDREKVATEIREHQKKMRSLFEVSSVENFTTWMNDMVAGDDEVWIDNPAMWLNLLDLYPNNEDIHSVWDPVIDQRSGTMIKVDKDYVAVLSPKHAVYISEGKFTISDKQGNTSDEMPLSGTFIYVKRNNEWKVVHIHYSWEEN